MFHLFVGGQHYGGKKRAVVGRNPRPSAGCLNTFLRKAGKETGPKLTAIALVKGFWTIALRRETSQPSHRDLMFSLKSDLPIVQKMIIRGASAVHKASRLQTFVF